MKVRFFQIASGLFGLAAALQGVLVYLSLSDESIWPEAVVAESWQPADSGAAMTSPMQTAVTTSADHVDPSTRPLFSNTRRPFVQPAEVLPPPPSPPLQLEQQPQPLAPAPVAEPVFDVNTLRLLGTMDLNGEKRALVAVPENVNGQWLKTGDSISGWQIQEIADAAIVFVQGGQSINLKLYVDKTTGELAPSLNSQ